MYFINVFLKNIVFGGFGYRFLIKNTNPNPSPPYFLTEMLIKYNLFVTPNGERFKNLNPNPTMWQKPQP